MDSLRRLISYWGIRGLLWATQTHLTHDDGYELLGDSWGVEVVDTYREAQDNEDDFDNF